MARKVFISILGTGFYGECKYEKDGFTSSKTRFVQQATIEYLTSKEEWTSDCKTIFLLTKKAKEDNWNEIIKERENKKNNNVEEYIGLEAIIKSMNLPFECISVDIPDGKNEKEMWMIFTKMFKSLQDKDELYFDLTHSFRYLPMLLLVFGNYSKFLKNTKVKHISYGNYEIRENGIAPIVDLLSLSTLQDWTFAAADYLENGNVDKLTQLGKESLHPILQRDETRTPDAENLRDFINRLMQVVVDRQTCRGMKIIKSKELKELKDLSNQLNEMTIEPFGPIFDKIKTSLEDFDVNENIRNGFATAKWCYNNNSYQSAATILQESVVSLFCERHSIRIDDEEKREIINTAFYVKKRETPEGNWRTESDEMRIAVREVLCDPLLKNKALIDLFGQLTDIRNDFNHSGMRSKQLPLNSQKIKGGIKKCLDGLSEILLSEHEEALIEKLNPIIINLSNHPSDSWSNSQRIAAIEYGEIIDLPFPEVDPAGDEFYIEGLADEYVEKIQQIANKKSVTIHLMGEMTLTFAIISRLHNLDMACIASTSRRVVTETQSGHKEIQFEFEQFRNYII